MTQSTAAVEVPEWSSPADAWVELWSGLAATAREAIAAAAPYRRPDGPTASRTASAT